MDEQRYSRLARFGGFSATLAIWQRSCCAVIGLGGLGCGLAAQLTRMGVKRLILIDRDVVGEENLGHQALYTEAHATAGMPKVHAAAAELADLNSSVELTPFSHELTRHNILDLLADAELLFDGLDNYYTRLLLNDYARSTGKPYFYAGVVRGELSARAIASSSSSCLRCMVDTPPAPGQVPTCSAEGLFPPLLGVANTLQLDMANRYLSTELAEDADAFYSLELASWRLRRLVIARRPDCPACAGRYEYLDGTLDGLASQSCAADRAEVQLATPLDLALVHGQLAASSEFELKLNPYCLVADAGGLRYTIFPSGKIVLSGDADPVALNRFVATYLGV
jgi:adenylyltransferase/sulfurtransferase